MLMLQLFSGRSSISIRAANNPFAGMALSANLIYPNLTWLRVLVHFSVLSRSMHVNHGALYSMYTKSFTDQSSHSEINFYTAVRQEFVARRTQSTTSRIHYVPDEANDELAQLFHNSSPYPSASCNCSPSTLSSLIEEHSKFIR